jgi:hypothetical protein
MAGKRGSAKSLAEREFTITRIVDAPRSLVFKAWTDPEHISSNHEPVDRLLPELADRKVIKRIDGPLDDTVPASRPITTRDLLT